MVNLLLKLILHIAKHLFVIAKKIDLVCAQELLREEGVLSNKIASVRRKRLEVIKDSKKSSSKFFDIIEQFPGDIQKELDKNYSISIQEETDQESY